MSTFRNGMRRARRGGTESLEFALIFPIFLVIVLGLIDYSWYFYQKAAVAQAARIGCQAATQMNRVVDNYADAAQDAISTDLMRSLGVSCSGGVGCTIGLTDLTTDAPPRLICDVAIDYASLTGFFGNTSNPSSAASRLLGWSGGTYIPSVVRARSSSIFEEAE